MRFFVARHAFLVCRIRGRGLDTKIEGSKCEKWSRERERERRREREREREREKEGGRELALTRVGLCSRFCVRFFFFPTYVSRPVCFLLGWRETRPARLMLFTNQRDLRCRNVNRNAYTERITRMQQATPRCQSFLLINRSEITTDPRIFIIEELFNRGRRGTDIRERERENRRNEAWRSVTHWRRTGKDSRV